MIRILITIVTLSQTCFGADFVPEVGPDRKRITVHCGDVGLLLRQNTQWTPGRFDYRGQPMTTEKSAYGTVFSLPGIGFIGTGHFENEPEDLKSVRFFVDDQPVESPGETLKGNTFRFERESRIRQFSLKNSIEVRDDCIFETTSIATNEEVPLKLVYHFMHAWTPSVSAFSSGKGDEIISENLPDEEEGGRKFYLRKSVDWIAVFEPKSGQFAVSRLLESPQNASETSQIWNVPGTYRKYYLTAFMNKTVPAGFKGTWKMVTGFGEAQRSEFESKAKSLAAELAR